MGSTPSRTASNAVRKWEAHSAIFGTIELALIPQLFKCWRYVELLWYLYKEGPAVEFNSI